MPKLAVADGAILKCDAGSAPSPLTVTSDPLIQIEGALVATIFDHLPGVNVKPFGVCAITGAPCVPVTPAPWMPGEVIILLAAMFPILPQDSTLTCAVGGTIRVISPGQSTLFVDSLSELDSSLLAALIPALLSIFADLTSALLHLADLLPVASTTDQRLLALIRSSGIKAALDNVRNMTTDERIILNHILSLPGAGAHVRELLSGAHIRIYDGGALASLWGNLGSFYGRPSTHKGTRGAVDGPLSHTTLFGAWHDRGRRYTWVQFERHPGKNPAHIGHPDVPYLPDPYVPYIDPDEAVDEAGHIHDWNTSRKTHRNQGPYGTSRHREHGTPGSDDGPIELNP